MRLEEHPDGMVVGVRRDANQGLDDPWVAPRTRRDVSLELLRGFELTCSGHPVDLPLGAQRLLAFLALQPRSMSRSFVAARLWMDCGEERAAGNLRSALWRLNRPGHRLVKADSRIIRLMPDVMVDLHEMTQLAHALLDGSASVDTLQLGGLALTSELLPDWYDEWVVVERERFRQLRLHALEVLCDQLVAARKFAHAIQVGLAAVSSEPLRESAHRALIRAYIEEGNQAEAIRQYRLCRDVLQRELGIDPSPVTASLVRALSA